MSQTIFDLGDPADKAAFYRWRLRCIERSLAVFADERLRGAYIRIEGLTMYLPPVAFHDMSYYLEIVGINLEGRRVHPGETNWPRRA